jgi:hypothetical protein
MEIINWVRLSNRQGPESRDESPKDVIPLDGVNIYFQRRRLKFCSPLFMFFYTSFRNTMLDLHQASSKSHFVTGYPFHFNGKGRKNLQNFKSCHHPITISLCHRTFSPMKLNYSNISKARQKHSEISYRFYFLVSTFKAWFDTEGGILTPTAMNMIESEKPKARKPNQKYLEQLTKVGSDISVALEHVRSKGPLFQ